MFIRSTYADASHERSPLWEGGKELVTQIRCFDIDLFMKPVVPGYDTGDAHDPDEELSLFRPYKPEAPSRSDERFTASDVTVDILINNAGFGSISTLKADDVLSVAEVQNNHSPQMRMYSVHYALAAQLRSKNPLLRVVTVSSGSSHACGLLFASDTVAPLLASLRQLFTRFFNNAVFTSPRQGARADAASATPTDKATGLEGATTSATETPVCSASLSAPPVMQPPSQYVRIKYWQTLDPLPNEVPVILYYVKTNIAPGLMEGLLGRLFMRRGRVGSLPLVAAALVPDGKLREVERAAVVGSSWPESPAGVVVEGGVEDGVEQGKRENRACMGHEALPVTCQLLAQTFFRSMRERGYDLDAERRNLKQTRKALLDALGLLGTGDT